MIVIMQLEREKIFFKEVIKMASHAGLKYVLRTEKGYVNENGDLTPNLEEALVIPLSRFGYVTDPKKVYMKLGFKNLDLENTDLSFYIVEPSYDSRLGILENIYMDMGYSWGEAKREIEGNIWVIENLDLFYQKVRALQEKAFCYNARNGYKTIKTDIILVECKDGKRRNNTEVGRKRYYSCRREDGKKVFGKMYQLSIPLKSPHVEKFFSLSDEQKDYYNTWQIDGLASYLVDFINSNKVRLHLSDDFQVCDIQTEDGFLTIYTNEFVGDAILKAIEQFYEEKEMHVTRMFGSYVLLQRLEAELRAVLATEVPIEYCPLMIKLLKEVGGDKAEALLQALKNKDKEMQKHAMMELINEVVIKGGYFDTSRPLNSCEANVLFGASEILSSAFQSNLLDAAVIVSNNLGTIITTNAGSTQGAVKRMTGLFYTSPSAELMATAKKEGIVPVFPITASIDQLEGVKRAISLGYKRIAVTVAASDNYLLEKIAKLEKDGVKIYKFGLCSTGVSRETAMIMKEYADVIWSCASRWVRDLIEPSAIAQVGGKIPVHIMTEDAWPLVQNHLQVMSGQDFDVSLEAGDNKPIVLNQGSGFKLIRKKDMYPCTGCPHPCI